MAYLNCRYPGKHCILNHFELLGLFPHQRNKGLPVNLWITFQHISATQIPLPLPGLADSMKACQRHDPFLQPRSAESPSTLWLAAGRNKNQDLFHAVQRKNIWWSRLEFLKETQEYIECFRRNIRNYSILPNAVSHHNAVLRVDACLMIWWWAISPVSKQYITYPETLMSKVEMQNAKIQLTLRTTICTRCLSKLKARCPEKVEAIKLRMDSSSRSILECQHRELVWLWVLAWTSLNREEMICNVFGWQMPSK